MITLFEFTPSDPTFALVPWAVFFPVIGMLLNILLGKRLGEKGVGTIASLAAGLSFGTAVLMVMTLAQTGYHPVQIQLADWIVIGTLNLGWTFRVDTLSVTMMLVVAGVGTLIHVYSIGYMHSDVRHNGDPGRFQRFFVYLNLFIAAMMILVTADNFAMLFVGWEGVGLCSYLLIGFWFEKGAGGTANAKAAKKAFITNRIGDFGLLIALFIMFAAFGSLDFDTVFEKAPELARTMPGVVLAITLFMLLGVAGKSAQLPLYVWLPDAMAGPTPVSALIYAATMVTAGVYLVARSQALYAQVPLALDVVAWVGALTAIFAATIAVAQNDIKKVLAYSTISQLGFMVAAVGMGAYVAGMFHLVTHAFFKALLFLAAGSIILGMEHGHESASGSHGHGQAADFDPQDMLSMGGLKEKMPLTFWVYLIGALALSGVAPLAGFFSKDEILVSAFEHQPAIFAVLLSAAFLTAFYMGRQVLLVFFGKPRTAAAGQAVESPAIVTVPLIVLALFSAVGGAINLPGTHWLETWLEHTFEHPAPAEFVLWIAGLSLTVAIFGLFTAWMVYGRRHPLSQTGEPDPLQPSLGRLFTGMQNKWWMDEFYQAAILQPYWKLSNTVLAKWFDQEVIDGAANDLGRLARRTGNLWSRMQNGYVRSYSLVFLLGVVAIMTYLLLK